MRNLIAITQLSLSLTASHDANYVASPCLVAAGLYIACRVLVLRGFSGIWPGGDPSQMWKKDSYLDFHSPGKPRVLLGRDLEEGLCLQGVGCLSPLGAPPIAKKNKGPFPAHFIYLKGKTASVSEKLLIAAL